MPILGSFGAGSARGLGLTACSGSKFVVATGGCESTDGDYKIHSFNASGCFTVTSAGLPSGCGGDGSYVDYLVVAAGGNGSDGGGGGGGMRSSNRTYPTSCGSAGCGPTAGIEVSVSNYPIVVGGIAGRTSPGGGGDSSFLQSLHQVEALAVENQVVGIMLTLAEAAAEAAIEQDQVAEILEDTLHQKDNQVDHLQAVEFMEVMLQLEAAEKAARAQVLADTQAVVQAEMVDAVILLDQLLLMELAAVEITKLVQPADLLVDHVRLRREAEARAVEALKDQELELLIVEEVLAEAVQLLDQMKAELVL